MGGPGHDGQAPGTGCTAHVSGLGAGDAGLAVTAAGGRGCGLRSLGRGAAAPGQPPLSFSISLISGRNIAMTIVPTTPASRTIIRGSIIEVRASTARSTSSS